MPTKPSSNGVLAPGERAPSYPPPPAERGFYENPFLLWFGFLGGAAAWAIQHGIGYGLTEISCHSNRLTFTVVGVNAADFLSVLLTLIAALTALVAALIASRNLPQRLSASPIEKAGAPESRGRSRFMAYAGFILNSLFFLAILSGGMSFFFLGPC